MKVLGIITEYNPMHNGHIYHIQKSKEITNADYVVLVMSGSFTQTGNISTLDKFTKAKIATEYGVDLVIELPTIYATSSSEYFAMGAVSLLNSLGIIDCICFGSECIDIQVLNNIATKLIDNEKTIWEEIKLQDKNNTFAKSRSNVLSKYLNDNEINEVSKPNNILGIEYIKSLKKLNSNITPYLIQRHSSDYNEHKLNENELNFTSATSIRNAIKNNDIENIIKYIPESIYNKLIQNKILLNTDLFNLLKYKIISMTEIEISNIHEVTEGLEHKLTKSISSAKNYDEIINLMKSKRYIENKIKRILINILLQKDKENFKKITDLNTNYAHILAMSSNGRILLSNISKGSNIPIFTSINNNVISKQNSEIKYMINLDVYSSNIHSILTNTSLNKDFTNRL
ncbi:MAG: nucleotidyltransferase [Clostridia bacterium]|nr:nucleotidyltransferase [Clostridia bacterium]MDD4386383.1 nucleotidyltransferase [Clostridia bacterium]